MLISFCIVRSMLQAIVSYFPEKEKVAGVGALSYSVEDRKKIATQSRNFKCPQCGPIVKLLPESSTTEKDSNPNGSGKENGVPEQSQNSSNNQAGTNQQTDEFSFEKLSPEQRELLMKHDTSDVVEEFK